MNVIDNALQHPPLLTWTGSELSQRLRGLAQLARRNHFPFGNHRSRLKLGGVGHVALGICLFPETARKGRT